MNNQGIGAREQSNKTFKHSANYRNAIKNDINATRHHARNNLIQLFLTYLLHTITKHAVCGRQLVFLTKSVA